MTDEEVCRYLWSCRLYVSKTLGAERAEDVIQQAAMHYLEASRSRYIEFPRAYAARILHAVMGHEVAEIIRRRKVVSIDEALALPDPGRNPFRDAKGEEQRQMLRANLATLAPKQQEIVIRSFIDDEPQERTMEAMDLTETQYRLLKSRSKNRLIFQMQRRMRRTGPTIPAKKAA